MLSTLIKRKLCGLFTKCLYAIQGKPDPFVRFSSDRLYSHLNLEGTSIDPRSYPDRKKYLLTDSVVSNEHVLAHCQKIASIDEVPANEIKGGIFYVYFQCDSDAIYHVTKIIAHGGMMFPPLEFGNTEYRFVNRAAHDVISHSWRNGEKISHLILNVHENICEAIELTKQIDGDYVEIGVFKGGSAFTALNYHKKIGVNRRAWLFDTFDGFNYEEARQSSDAIWRDTHSLFGADETMKRIAKVLDETGAEFRLIKANICDHQLPGEITKIAVANIDVDLYEATKAALEKVAPLVVRGGIIICEDPTSTPGLYGACVAMHAFLKSTEIGHKFLPVFKGGQYFLIKMAD